MPNLPTLVQHVATGVDSTHVTAPTLTITLRNKSLTGNCLVICVHWTNTGTLALASTPVTDNKNNSWSTGPTAASTFSMAVFYVLDAIPGTQTIQIAFTGTPNGADVCALGGWASEFYNCQTSGAIGPTGNTVFSGSPISITLSGSPNLGDLVLMFGLNHDSANSTFDFVFTSGSGFDLVSAQRYDGKICQASTNTTSSTPSFSWTVSPSVAMNAVAITIKAANAGTAPGPGIRIIRDVMHRYTDTAFAAQFPCQGNLIVGSWGSAEVFLTAITDDASANVWNTGVRTGNTQIFWAANAQTSLTRTITPTFSGTATIMSDLHLFDISGAATSPFDTSDSRTGTQNVNANLTSGIITPSTLNGLIINRTGITFHTVTGTVTDANGHTPDLYAAMNSKNDDASSGGTPSSQLDEDDMLAMLYNTDTLPVTFIYSSTANGTNPPTGVSSWASITAAFMAAPVTQPVLESAQSNIFLGKTAGRFAGLGE